MKDRWHARERKEVDGCRNVAVGNPLGVSSLFGIHPARLGGEKGKSMNKNLVKTAIRFSAVIALAGRLWP